MNERHVFKHPFGWISIFILLISIILLSARLLRTRKTEQEKQVTQVPLEEKLITSEAKEPEKRTEDEPKSKAKDSSKLQQSLFTIQVASFQDKAKAEMAAEELKKKGYTPELSSKDLAEKGVWHRVWVGDFDSEDEASKLLNTLKKDYKDSFIKLR